MKKKSILKLILVCLPLLVVIGFSTWIIVYEIIFTPEIKISQMESIFGTSAETIYNGEEQAPKPNGVQIDEARLTYKYKAKNEETIIDGKPINAGDYVVTVILDGTDECEVDFKIRPVEVELNPNAIELSFDEVPRKWAVSNSNDDFKNKLYNSVSFIYNSENTPKLEPNDYEIIGIHNGDYYYGNFSENSNLFYIATMYKNGSNEFSNNVIGTTYIVYIKLLNSNFIFKDILSDTSTTILKYKTVEVGSGCYTIEDAINVINNGPENNLWLKGDKSTASSYVVTSFCNLTKNQGNPYNYRLVNSKFTYDLNSEKNIYIPHANGNPTNYEKQSVNNTDATDFQANKNYNVFSSLIIPNNISLDVKGKICITSCVVGSGSVRDHGVILNRGLITIKNGGKLYAYGYLKSGLNSNNELIGEIICESGSEIHDVLAMYDWIGGTNALTFMPKKQAFPVDAWSVHNISCKIKLYRGSKLVALATLCPSSSYYEFLTTLIGADSNEKNCIFRPSQLASSSDYILKYSLPPKTSSLEYSEHPLFKINGANKVPGNIDKIEINGQYEDSTLAISLSNYSFETSPKIAAPISYMNIIIKENGKLTLTNSSYIFMPATSLIVEKNAILNVGEQVYVAFDKANSEICQVFAKNLIDKGIDAKLILNGTLICSGHIGGVIDTNESGIIVNSSSYAIPTIMVKDTDSKNIATISNYKLTGNICDNNSYIDNTNFEDGNAYVSSYQEKKSKYYFNKLDGSISFTINFYDGDEKLETKIIVIVGNNSSEVINYIITGNEYSYSKLHYNFDDWLLENGDSASGYEMINGECNEINLYASWALKEYNMLYKIDYIDSDDNVRDITSEVTYINKCEKFTLENFDSNGLFTIKTSISYLDKNFDGWYIKIDEDNIFEIKNRFTLDYFEIYLNLISNDGITIYAKFTDAKMYTVKFVDNNDKNDDFPDLKLYSNNPLAILSEYNTILTRYNSNQDYENYFVGWYSDDTYTSEVTPSTIITNDLTIYAKWLIKNRFVFKDSNNADRASIYYVPNSKIYLISDNGFTKDGEDNSGVITKYSFSNWLLEGENYEPKQFNAGDEVDTSEFGDNNVYAKPEFIEKQYFKIQVTTTNDGGKFTCTYFEDGYEKNEEIGVNSSNNTISFIVDPSSNLTIKSITYNSKNNQSAKIKVGNNSEKDLEVTTYEISGFTQIKIQSNSSCIVEGTLVAMADGTYKKAEDVKIGDIVICFNHEIGKYEPNMIIINDHNDQGLSEYEVITLYFSDGTNTRIAFSHGFFDVDLNKYVYIKAENCKSFIGHYFYGIIGNGNLESKKVKLIDVKITKELTRVYSPVTAKHLNIVVDNMLTMPADIDGLFNIFEYDRDTLRFNQEKMKSDIEKYGLLTYDDFKDIIPYEVYQVIPTEYLGVSIGKGMLTWEQFKSYAEKWSEKIYEGSK